MRRVSVVAVCDVVEERAVEAAEEEGARAFADYREMFDVAEMDAVYVCVPPFGHGEPEVLAAERGIALFVEKPVAVTMEAAREVESAIEEHGVISCVGFQDRHLDILGEVKSLIQGRPVGLALGYWMGGMPGVDWWRRKEMSGGQSVEQTVHITDTARYLFGEVQSVYAAGRTGLMEEVEDYNIEDGSAATLIFENGTVATVFTACFLSCGNKGGIDIFPKDLVIE